ncbi:unnamed protein product [Effrenium voratum]|uniref:Uncharacterized protein n=1 Tax=Effrenium voratum TaxID=2562239 RepID=A0AA36NEC5_9DINO|nr:unnamed protein product [Effrenium voratum]
MEGRKCLYCIVFLNSAGIVHKTLGNVNFLDINMADIMRDIKQHTNFSVVEDSDSGGSDSAPSGDNLGEKELRQVEDNLVCRRPMRAKRKPSRTKTGTKRLSKVPSKREVAPAVRHRARTKSATKPMAPAEVKETKEAPELPRRDLLQRVVAFGQTTYLATSPSSPTGFTSPLRRFQERPERRELLRNAGSCMLRGEESQSCTSLAAPRAASLAREARERRPMTATSREKSGALRSHSDGRRSSDQLRQAPVKWISWDEDLPLGELSLSPSRTLRPRVRKAEMGLLLPWAALALEDERKIGSPPLGLF